MHSRGSKFLVLVFLGRGGSQRRFQFFCYQLTSVWLSKHLHCAKHCLILTRILVFCPQKKRCKFDKYICLVQNICAILAYTLVYNLIQFWQVLLSELISKRLELQSQNCEVHSLLKRQRRGMSMYLMIFICILYFKDVSKF